MSEQIMRDNLVVLAQAYADAAGLALTTVSKRIHGRHSFFDDFMAGEASTSITTYFAMVDKFRAAWPKGAKWPKTRDVPKLMRSVVTDAHRVKRAKLTSRTGDGRFEPKAKRRNGDGARS